MILTKASINCQVSVAVKFLLQWFSEITSTLIISYTVMSFSTQTLQGSLLQIRSILYLLCERLQYCLSMRSFMRIKCNSLWNWRSDLQEWVWVEEDVLFKPETDQHLQTAAMSWLVRAVSICCWTSLRSILDYCWSNSFFHVYDLWTYPQARSMNLPKRTPPIWAAQSRSIKY